MYDINKLVTQLQTDPNTSSYQTKLAESLIQDFNYIVDVPDTSNVIIEVAYDLLQNQNPNVARQSLLPDEAGIDLTESFILHISCKLSVFHFVQRNVFKALIGKNLEPLEDNFTGLIYKQGGPKNVKHGNMYWLDIWQVGLPSYNPFLL